MSTRPSANNVAVCPCRGVVSEPTSRVELSRGSTSSADAVAPPPEVIPPTIRISPETRVVAECTALAVWSVATCRTDCSVSLAPGARAAAVGNAASTQSAAKRVENIVRSSGWGDPTRNGARPALAPVLARVVPADLGTGGRQRPRRCGYRTRSRRNQPAKLQVQERRLDLTPYGASGAEGAPGENRRRYRITHTRSLLPKRAEQRRLDRRK